jgi:hypothetical protein
VRARGLGILAGIDIRFHDVAEIVDVITEYGRDVLGIFPENGIMARRCAESRFASGNRGFPHELFAFVEIGALLGNADDNLWGTGDTVSIPITLWLRRRRDAGRRRRPQFGATSDQSEKTERESNSKQRLAGHKDAHSNACPPAFNLKHLELAPPKNARKRGLFLPRRAESDSLCGRGFPMNNRLFALLIVVCLALGGGGCASEELRKKNEEEILLPRQTGSFISRRANIEPDASHKPKKTKKADKKDKKETKQPPKKTPKTEKPESEKVKEPKPEPTPEETTAPPDRFR